jgi:hypothetical protein
MIVDSCKPCLTYKYDIDKIQLQNLIYSTGVNGLNWTGTDTTVLKYSQFGIMIDFHKIVYSSINYSLTNNAFAIDCPIEYLLQHKIESISIFSLNKFDQDHLADSDISDYFKAIIYPIQSKPNTIDSTLAYQYGINYMHTGSSDNNLELLLNKAPQSDSLFRFVVKVKLSNNELVDTTEMIKLLK